ncbi:ATP-dependent DNA helicase RecG [Clostridium bovifaecis]|uniref:ATP-dependent DNA helicase RecG n=1 Tax=Clostridium bovifaecis TaxID=2184719 RepID=A0A6I6F207_9CLOT|nr:ATP-dependent DNA helicase RecG [Clostridium bovifaecis]
MYINDDISTLKGVGPKTKELLNKCGIYTILDFLLYFPRDYEQRVYCSDIGKIIENKKIIVKAIVQEIKRDIPVKKNMVISTVVFKSGNSTFEGKWFNQTYMKNKFRLNGEYILSGNLELQKNKKVLINPIIVDGKSTISSINPKYSLSGSLTNSFFIKTLSNVLSNIKIAENLPKEILKKYNLCSLDEAIRNIHNPERGQSLKEAIKRLKFQELFTYSLKLLMLKKYSFNKGINFSIAPELKLLKEKLPFPLTSAQNRVIREILLDEKKDKPMNRLVQGDVGSGKTIIAFIALFNVIKNGYQGVLMAPTEILANQHYEEAKKIFKEFNLNIQLLCGSTTNKNKKIIKEDLKLGEIDIIIGTHALLEEDVEFYNLGMVVTDEQHRFGVRQRTTLYHKNNNIDVLVMSATPIPRTLALSIYGDLEISTIDELPPGRKKVDTFCIDKKQKKRVYNFALKEIQNGTQVYIVCPLVEENEDMKVTSVERLYQELKESYFKNIDIEILHGKMASKLKDEVMEKFKNGQIKVLISTTVIEVGVNVPNATLMIIENAERFGLSQLHQLRGRVGRGSKKSYCILVSDLKSEVSKKRMEIMTSSNDGFFIAEEDLKLRGSGEIFGVNQHGDDGLIIANLVEDFNLFKYANQEAKLLINSDRKEDIIIKNEILENLQKTSKYICFN